MQLKVVFNYRGCSVNYLSVYLCLMKVPYDDELPWPLRGMFQVKLLNQINDYSHHAVTRSVYNVNMLISNDSTSASKEVWHGPQFIKINLHYSHNTCKMIL